MAREDRQAIENTSARGPRRFSTFTSLRHPDFRLLWTTSLLNSGANWLQQVTLGWLAYDLSDSALIAGLVFGIRSLPQLIVGPIGGALGDRYERKLGLLVNSGYMAVLALAFAALLAFGEVKIWHLLVFTTLQGLGQALVNPVRQALVANTVPRGDLMNAIALNSFAFSTMRVIGPTFAGALIALSGPALNFGLQSVAFVVTFLLVLPLRTPYSNLRPGHDHGRLLDTFTTGLRYVKTQPTILGLTLLGIGPAFFTTPINLGLLPVFAREALGVDSAGLGVLYSMQGVGAVIATLALASMGNFRNKGLLVAGAAVANALAVCLYSQVTVFAIALPLLAMATFGFTAFSTVSQTIIQTITPDELRARVMGIHMVDHGLTPLGALIFGAVAQLYDVSTAITIAGLCGLTFVLWTLVRFPSVRGYQVSTHRTPDVAQPVAVTP